MGIGARIIFKQQVCDSSVIDTSWNNAYKGIFGLKQTIAEIKNGQIGVISNYDVKRKDLTVSLDDGRMVSVDCNKYNKINLGYGLTSNNAQGMTLDNVVGLVDDYQSMGDLVVMFTRHRKELQVNYSGEHFRLLQEIEGKGLTRSMATASDMLLSDEDKVDHGRVTRYLQVTRGVVELRENLENLRAEQGDVFDHRCVEMSLYKQTNNTRKQLAISLLDNWDKSGIYARQYGVKESKLEEVAGIKVGEYSLMERKAIEVIGEYYNTNLMVRSLRDEMSKDYGSVLINRHKDYSKYEGLLLRQNSLASKIYNQRSFYEPLLKVNYSKDNLDKRIYVSDWGYSSEIILPGIKAVEKHASANNIDLSNKYSGISRDYYQRLVNYRECVKEANSAYYKSKDTRSSVSEELLVIESEQRINSYGLSYRILEDWMSSSKSCSLDNLIDSAGINREKFLKHACVGELMVCSDKYEKSLGVERAILGRELYKLSCSRGSEKISYGSHVYLKSAGIDVPALKFVNANSENYQLGKATDLFTIEKVLTEYNLEHRGCLNLWQGMETSGKDIFLSKTRDFYDSLQGFGIGSKVSYERLYKDALMRSNGYGRNLFVSTVNNLFERFSVMMTDGRAVALQGEYTTLEKMVAGLNGSYNYLVKLGVGERSNQLLKDNKYSEWNSCYEAKITTSAKLYSLLNDDSSLVNKGLGSSFYNRIEYERDSFESNRVWNESLGLPLSMLSRVELSKEDYHLTAHPVVVVKSFRDQFKRDLGVFSNYCEQISPVARSMGLSSNFLLDSKVVALLMNKELDQGLLGKVFDNWNNRDDKLYTGQALSREVDRSNWEKVDIKGLCENVCANVDIERLADSFRGKDKKSYSGDSVRYGNRGSFVVNKNKGTWYDFTLDKGGNAFNLLYNEGGKDFKGALGFLQNYVSSNISSEIENYLGGKPFERLSKLSYGDVEVSGNREEEIRISEAKQATARSLYDCSQDIKGTQGEGYLLSRGINLSDVNTDDVRYISAGVKFKYNDTDRTIYNGALLLGIRNQADEITAVQLTYLCDGKKQIDKKGRSSKYQFGVSKGGLSCIHRGEENKVAIVGEGLETVSSIKMSLDRTQAVDIYCSSGISNLGSIVERGYERVILAGDYDGKNSNSRIKLEQIASEIRESGKAAFIVLPYSSGEKVDFNDLLQKENGKIKIGEQFNLALSAQGISVNEKLSALKDKDITNSSIEDVEKQVNSKGNSLTNESRESLISTIKEFVTEKIPEYGFSDNPSFHHAICSGKIHDLSEVESFRELSSRTVINMYRDRYKEEHGEYPTFEHVEGKHALLDKTGDYLGEYVKNIGNYPNENIVRGMEIKGEYELSRENILGKEIAETTLSEKEIINPTNLLMVQRTATYVSQIESRLASEGFYDILNRGESLESLSYDEDVGDKAMDILNISSQHKIELSDILQEHHHYSEAEANYLTKQVVEYTVLHEEGVTEENINGFIDMSSRLLERQDELVERYSDVSDDMDYITKSVNHIIFEEQTIIQNSLQYDQIEFSAEEILALPHIKSYALHCLNPHGVLNRE